MGSSIHDEHRLSQEFREIESLCDAGPICLGDILEHIKGRGEALFTLFLAGPFILPIPLPGLSIPFGILVATFGFSLATGFKPWLPQVWVMRPLPEAMVRRFCHIAKRLLLKVERLFRPRWAWIHRSPLVKQCAGLMIVGCGLLLALPLPPGTNAPPASVIVCLSLAMLEEDGLMMVIGYSMFFLNAIFFALLAFFGYAALSEFVQKFL